MGEPLLSTDPLILDQFARWRGAQPPQVALHIIVWQTFVLQVEGKIVSSLFAILSLLHFIIRFMTIHLDDETGEWGPLTAFHSAKPAITKVLSGSFEVG